MAHVQYADAIKTVSGALTKINKKSPHAGDQKMVLATHRVAPSTNTHCSRLYLRGLSSVTRTTLPDQDELDRRAKFAAVSRAVAQRRQNLATIATDQAAFVAQKDNPDGKKTFTAYLWKVCGEAYDQQNP